MPDAGAPSAGDDFAEIISLRSEYCWASDEADAERYASLFTSDGLLDLGEDFGGIFRGADDIRARIGEILTAPDPLPATLHFVSSPRIQIDGEAASGRWYVTVYHRPRPGDPSPVRFVGRYDDEYARTAQGWRFRRVRLEMFYFAGY